MSICKGAYVIYKFQYFPEECGIVVEELKDEPTVFIVEFLQRTDPETHRQRISTDYLRLSTQDEIIKYSDQFNNTRHIVNETSNKYPTIEDSLYKGILTIKRGTVCAISNIELEDGEEIVIIHKDMKTIYSRTWIEAYWKYTNIYYQPIAPITNEKIVDQKDVERFTVSLTN